MRIPVLVCFLLLLLVPSHVWGQQPRLDKVTIASGGHIVHFMPLDLAVAKGFFADEGLDPEITQLKGGTATAQALLAGQIDFSLNSIDHAFKAAVQGKDNLRMVALLNRLPGMVLVVDSRLRSKVKSISDLKGMALGVTSKGSATHMVLASLLSRSGIDPAAVNIVDAGSATFPPALENRQIAGGIALEPFASILAEQGKVFVLADLNTLKDTERFFGGPYNQAGVMTRQDVIDRQPGLVQKVVNVHLRALKWIQGHTPQEIAEALPMEVVGTDRERYIKTLKKLKEFYSPDGIINPNGVDNVYQSMLASEALPANQPIDTKVFFDNSFVQGRSDLQERASPTKSTTSWWEKIDWLNGFVGAVFGSVLTFFASRWRLKKETVEKQQAQQDRDLANVALTDIKKQLATKEEDFQKKHGFVPIDAGLKPFEDRICKRVSEANKSVKLCLSTPLLYSLKANPWRMYSRKILDQKFSEYWPNEFCEQFRNTLRNRVSSGNLLNVELIYLDERSTKKLVAELNPSVPYTEHSESLNFFIDEVLQKDEQASRKLCNLKVHRVMRVPFYLALFDTDDAGGCCGIVAFANDNYLLSEHMDERRTTEDIARTLQAYEFTNHDVVRFLNQLFEQTKLLSDERLVSFLEICIASGFSWSAIANGVPGTEKQLIPHATMLHIKEKP